MLLHSLNKIYFGVCLTSFSLWPFAIYLSDAIEGIQRRALRIIYPDVSYQAGLDKLNMVTL